MDMIMFLLGYLCFAFSVSALICASVWIIWQLCEDDPEEKE